MDQDVEIYGNGFFPIKVSSITCAKQEALCLGYKVRPVRLIHTALRLFTYCCVITSTSFFNRGYFPSFTNIPSHGYIMSVNAAFNDFKAFAMNSPLLLSAVSFLLVAQFVRYLLNRPKRLDLPVVGSPDTKVGDWQQELIKGSLTVRGGLQTKLT